MTESKRDSTVMVIDDPFADPDRGTGRTSKQMLEAPQKSIFVWCNSNLSYPLYLAKYLRREDLCVVSPGEINYLWCSSKARGGIVVDHAAHLSDRQIDELLRVPMILSHDGVGLIGGPSSAARAILAQHTGIIDSMTAEDWEAYRRREVGPECEVGGERRNKK